MDKAADAVPIIDNGKSGGLAKAVGQVIRAGGCPNIGDVRRMFPEC